jgi:hypothetical protein
MGVQILLYRYINKEQKEGVRASIEHSVGEWYSILEIMCNLLVETKMELSDVSDSSCI